MFTSPRLFRTSSFRLTLLYAGLTGASFLLLFGVVYWSTTRFMDRQIDATVASELAEIQADARDDGIDSMRGNVQAMVGRVPGYFYLLQDASGAVLAGNLPAVEPLPGVREWPGPARHRKQPLSGIRGYGVVLANGGYLMVALSTYQLHEMDEMVERSFLAGLALAMLLALGGGALTSLGVLRKIEVVSQTSRDIVGGDLQRRIAVRGSGDEFDHLAISLNTMLDRIQTLMEGLRQVSTDVAHDLRTPLTRLRQMLEAAREASGREETDAGIEVALAQADQLLATFRAILRLAQIEGGGRRTPFAPVDLGELLATLIETYEPVAIDAGHALVARLRADAIVHGDAELLAQLFANLIENAILHTPAGTRVSIGIEHVPGDISVIVSDNGPGVAEAERERITRRFYQVDPSRSSGSSGLGLSIASAIVTLHSAHLSIGDAGPGLRIAVSFPDRSGGTAN